MTRGRAWWRFHVLWRGDSWLLTWHAPWCRVCEHPGSGWRFERAPGYLAGLGFELSYPTREDGPPAIRTEAEHADALCEIDSILGQHGGEEPDGPDGERLTRLTALVEAYERSQLRHQLGEDRRSPRQRAFDHVESELRRLDVESVVLAEGTVTLGTGRGERDDPSRGGADTLLGAFEALEAERRDRHE